MTGLRAAPEGTADEPAHGSLKRNACSLVQGADNYCRQESVDLVIDDEHRQCSMRPGTAVIRAAVFQAPALAIEYHFD